MVRQQACKVDFTKLIRFALTPLAAISVALAVAHGAMAKTVDDYVQDGLIACWDGYENTGARFVHSDSLTEWKDLVGQRSFVFNANSGITVDGGALVFTGNDACYATLSAVDTDWTFERANGGTFEIVLISDPTTRQNVALQSSGESGIMIGANSRTALTKPPRIVFHSTTGAEPAIMYDWCSGTNTYSATYETALPQTILVNGESAPADTGNFTGSSKTTTLGHRTLLTSGQAFAGRIFAIRLYSQKLTPEQVAANHAVDVRRFIEGNFSEESVGADELQVAATPEECGSPTSSVGNGYDTFALTPGSNVTCTMPQTMMTNGTMVTKLDGWLLRKTVGGVSTETTNTSDNVSTCSFIHEAGTAMKLIWRWRTYEYDVQLEYIESTGQQYVDTGVVITPEMAVEADAQLTVKENSTYIFGLSRNVASDYLCFCVYVNSSGLWASGLQDSTGDWQTAEKADTDRHVHRLDCPARQYYRDGEAKGSARKKAVTTDTHESIYLFANHKEGTSVANYAKMRLYGCTIVSNGTPVRSYAAVRKEGRIGLYDSVTKTFLSAIGDYPVIAGPEDPRVDAVAVTADPDEYGTPTCEKLVGYGSFSVTNGEEVTVTMPQKSVPVGLTTARLKGWTLQKSHLGVITETTSTDANFDTCTFVHEEHTAVKVIWHWDTSTTWHVSPTGNDATGTGQSDAPFATMTNALAVAMDGDMVLLTAGTHLVSNQSVRVEKRVTIAGADGAIVRTAALVGSGNDPNHNQSIFFLDHPGAVLTNLVITGGQETSTTYYGRGVLLNGGGLVVDCAITNNQCKSPGAGVYLVGGGTVRNCLIKDNRTGTTGGCNVYLEKRSGLGAEGVVEDCVIEGGCLYVNTAGLQGGGVYMTGGALRRCLLCRNSQYGAKKMGEAIYATGGTIEFCTVTDHDRGNKSSLFGAVYIDGAVTVKNSIFCGNSCPDWVTTTAPTYTAIDNCTGDAQLDGTDNILGDPLFVDAANGDFRVRPGPGAGKGYRPDPVGETVPDLGTYVKSRNNTPDTDTLTLVTAISDAAVTDTTFTWTISNRLTAAVQTVSGKGADYATRSFTCGEGTYDVEVGISAEGGGSASRTYPEMFVVASTTIKPEPGVPGALAEAVAMAGNGTTIRLADGWYEYEGTITIDKGIRIEAVNGPSKTHIVATKKEGVVSRPIVLNHPDAVLANVDVSGYTEAGVAGASRSYGAVLMSDGMVTNCWLCNHGSDRTELNGGGAIYMTGGTVSDCVFTNNVNNGTHNSGGAIYATGANCVIERCRFFHCGVEANSTSGGALTIAAGAKAYSCLFAYNIAANGANVYVSGAATRLYNSTLVRATTSGSGLADDEYGVGYLGTGAGQSVCTINCLGWGNLVEAEDPGFKNVDKENYHLKASSTAVDAATPFEWMEGAKDLDGKPRILGRGPDLGCYERARSGLILLLK